MHDVSVCNIAQANASQINAVFGKILTAHAIRKLNIQCKIFPNCFASFIKFLAIKLNQAF
jgi:hypothetical protein